MTNPSDIIRPVQIKNREGAVVANVWYDEETRQVKMDPIDVALLTLRDFTRIHTFFRRVQGMRYNILQQGEN